MVETQHAMTDSTCARYPSLPAWGLLNYNRLVSWAPSFMKGSFTQRARYPPLVHSNRVETISGYTAKII
ncbi:hypothetical protein RSAG8_11684, partial [Rhizoctonia solani AG-8 WAC10335]